MAFEAGFQADAFQNDAFQTTAPAIEYVSPGHERCMRCGFIKGHSKMRREWTGLLVCEDTCWDPRHPQMTLRGVPDDQTVPWKRPEPAPVFLNPGDVTGDSL
jgi:hypothetical protein